MNAIIEVDLNAIVHNLQSLKKLVYPETKIIGVVKANAYGHGLVETARAVWTSGADILAVQSLEEAVELRVNKIKSPILVLGYVNQNDFYKAIEFDITLSVYDLDLTYLLNIEAKKHNRWAKVDFTVDTGMNRYGFKPYEAIEAYLQILKFEHIKIEGIHSHFASALDREFSAFQIKEFQNILFGLQQQKLQIPLVHMASSEAAYLYSESQFDAIRVGQALYGYSDIPEFQEKLLPALSLYSQIATIKRVAKGESVSYDRIYKAPSSKKIAVVPIGYADGYPRSLSNKAEVIVNGSRAKVVGRVCMNAIMLDVTGITCSIGDKVTLIGNEKEERITAQELASIADSTTREILSRLSPLIPREYHFK